MTRDEAIDHLHAAYAGKNVTLYLGAGVSVANGLPTWEKLVLSMYFSALSDGSLRSVFPNYLYAIAEWHLDRDHEPLEITARKIRKYYPDQDAFLDDVRETLYAGFAHPGGAHFVDVEREAIRDANPSLHAVASLCEQYAPAERGVRSVITYNYDSLLEIALGSYPFQSVWDVRPVEAGTLPIYHVHGFVPLEGEGSPGAGLVFTEEQYHRAAQDAYSWANLVQLQGMSSTVGLMVGLSLADRNMRRLLDAVRNTPLPTRNFALLQKPRWEQPSDDALLQIHETAQRYLEKFEKSGARRAGVKGPTWEDQIRRIIQKVEDLGLEQQTYVLEQLGVIPIWYDGHDEIPGILQAVAA